MIGRNREINIENFEKLYGKQAAHSKYREFNKKKKNMFLVSGLCGVIMLIISLTNSVFTESDNVTELKRNSYGEGKRTVSLVAQIGEAGDENVTVIVEEQKYTFEELEEFSNLFSEEVFSQILMDNKDLDNVTSDLNFFTNLKPYPFSVSWKTEYPLLINNSGKINKAKLREELSKAGKEEILVNICATITYEDYRKDIYGCILLKEKKSKTFEDVIIDLKDEIVLKGNENKQEEYQKLPEAVDGVRVTFKEKKTNNVIVILLLTMIIPVGLLIGQNKEIEKKLKRRSEELEEDYPEILNQYALFYCAGMNTRVIWQKICERYEDGLSRNGKRRYVYEEMLTAKQQMNDGLGEIESYEGFAKRCGNTKYRTFISLIAQSVVTGRHNLDIALFEELDKARQDETNRARMIAQEMSTKLLLPMIMMLIVVIVIVMVPAFISFN